MRNPGLVVPLAALFFACGGRIASSPDDSADGQTAPSAAAAPTSTATQSPSFPAPTSTGSSTQPPPSPGTASCAFQVTGTVSTTVTQSNAVAYPAGAEIPFIMIDCAVAPTVTFQLQWIPNMNGGTDDVGGGWVTEGDVEYFDGLNTTCSAKGLINGAPYASLGRSYQVGDQISADFSCTNLIDPSGDQASIKGHIDGPITPEPLGGP